jgi:hypothetical protein
VNFTNPSGHTVIARYRRSASDPLRADPASRFDLLWPGGSRFITQPFGNNNGGDLHFGSDGFLYIAMGDGGSANDPLHRAQDPGTLLGKMIRVDVGVPDGDVEGYDVPASNPFVGQAGVLPEIWAFGFRNPYRFSVDAIARGGTGALVIGDVGQATWEEINHEPAGAGGRNYGWRNREGRTRTSSPRPLRISRSSIRSPSAARWVPRSSAAANRGTSLGTPFFGRYRLRTSGPGGPSVRLTINQRGGGDA